MSEEPSDNSTGDQAPDQAGRNAGERTGNRIVVDVLIYAAARLLLVVARRLIVSLIGLVALVGLIIGGVIGSVGRVIRRLVLSVLPFDRNRISTGSGHRHCRRPVIDRLVVGIRLLARWLRTALGWSA